MKDVSNKNKKFFQYELLVTFYGGGWGGGATGVQPWLEKIWYKLQEVPMKGKCLENVFFFNLKASFGKEEVDPRFTFIKI